MRLGSSISSHARISWWSASVLATFALSIAALEQSDSTKIEGWTEVNKNWPLKESEFFVAVQKGHHFIEVKLPQGLSSDIDIKIDYYYTYKDVRPLFQLVPCKKNQIDILENHEDSLGPGIWHEHKHQVLRKDCENRNELAYNVLLHDPNDVFAWRIVELSARGRATVPNNAEDEVPTSLPPVDNEISDTISTGSPVTDKSQSEDKEGSHKGGQDSEPPATEATTNDSNQERSTDQPIDNTSIAPTEQPISLPPQPTDVPSESPGQESPERNSRYNLRPKRTTPKSVVERFRRWLESSEAPETDLHLICRPSSCDRSQFRHARFVALVKGLPAGIEEPLESGNQMFLNTNNKPLNVTAKSSGDLSDVDTCVNLTLFMDANTSMDFSVEDGSSPTGNRLLEKIERKARDSGAGQWEQFSRCITDYMPKLSTVEPDAHRLRLTFAPKPAAPGKQVAILSDPQRSVLLRKRFSPHDHLPNLLNPELKVDDDSLRKYWVLDNDGVRKAQFEIDRQVPEESTSEQGANAKRVIKVTNIDSKQESFDLTSRWIKIQDLKLLKEPARFEYQADPAQWVDRVEFWYQDVVNNVWRSHKQLEIAKDAPATEATNVLTSTEAPSTSTVGEPTASGEAPESAQAPTPNSTSIAAPASGEAPPSTGDSTRETPPVSNSSTPVSPPDNQAVSERPASPGPQDSSPVPDRPASADPQESSPAPSQSSNTPTLVNQPVELHVDINGLPSNEFRVRVRHYLTEAARNSEEPLNLTIKTLALADPCASLANGPYCEHGGKCQPTGTSVAGCECLQGYSGDRCQIVRPCEVLYNGIVGEELCRMANATCIRELPVFKCRFPDDEYMQCHELYQKNENGSLVPQEPAMTRDRLQENVDSKARTIIILSVFMLALLLFSLIIIINVVKRLMESKRRLKRVENEAHEMARRAQPGTSTGGSAIFGRPQTGRNKPPVSISYNNQAFDAD